MTRLRSDARDVGDVQVDAASVEVAAGLVVVLGRSGVSLPGEALGVAERDARAKSV
jgi:hypothetical protein